MGGRLGARAEPLARGAGGRLATGRARLRPASFLASGVSYGLGVMVDTRPGQRSIEHSGGGNAAFRYDLDDDLLIVMAASGGVGREVRHDRTMEAKWPRAVRINQHDSARSTSPLS